MIITSIAQLNLGFAMDNLSLMLQSPVFILTIFSVNIETFTLYAGLTGYLLSVICWHRALHQFVPSEAYILPNLGYVLTWVVSMIPPSWQGAFPVEALVGVPCIMVGLVTASLSSYKYQP